MTSLECQSLPESKRVLYKDSATQKTLNMLITGKVNNKICPSFCDGGWKQEDM